LLISSHHISSKLGNWPVPFIWCLSISFFFYYYKLPHSLEEIVDFSVER
jgi:hypothetical protein